MSKKKRIIKPGTVMVFEPKNLNPEYWDKLPEEDRVKYYGRFGYPKKEGMLPKLFIFVCLILDADGYDSGHCVMIDMDTQENLIMLHHDEFRQATDDEF